MDRAQSAEGIASILAPASLVVVGASPREGTVGNLLLRAVLAGAFTGPVWAVHPDAKEILGVPAFASVEDLPATPELAVIAVPAAACAAVADACGRKGVKGLVVVSAGFRETGEEGAALEAELEEVVRRHGMRMVGPNCVGVLHPSHGMDTVFADHEVRAGGTAILSQSGAVGIGLLQLAHRRGIGVASFVSLGNKTDVSGNDLLLAWEDDPEVRQIVFYLEGFGNPRNFVAIAPRVTRKKPVLLVKSGRSPAGSRAAASHTGALAESDRTVDAMLRQCGVLRFDTVQSLFDAALAFDHARPPAGDRVAIVTNSGGPAIMAADALPAAGLTLATLSTATRESLRSLLPAAAAVENPVDTLAGAGPEAFCRCVGTVLDDPGVDAVIAIHTSVRGDQGALHHPLRQAAERNGAKPLLCVLYGNPSPHVPTIASYGFPEQAVGALGALRTWAQHRVTRQEEPFSALPPLEVPDVEGWLTQGQTLRLLRDAGLPVVDFEVVADLEQAVAAAARIGHPVVLKADVEGVVHKSEAGLVATGLDDADALRDAWERVARRDDVREVLVMRHAPPGLEVLLGAVQDARYGPLVAFGLGGTRAEALQDVHFRLAPLGRRDADELVAELRAQTLLGPFRGQAARDRDALRDALLRLGALAWRHPEIAELDANPMLLYEHGAAIVDARMRIGKVQGPDVPAG